MTPINQSSKCTYYAGDTWEAAVADLGSTSQARIVITSRQEAIALQDEAEAHCSAPYRYFATAGQVSHLKEAILV